MRWRLELGGVQETWGPSLVTPKELAVFADGAIAILKTNERWAALVEWAKGPCEPTMVSDTLCAELEEMVRADVA